MRLGWLGSVGLVCCAAPVPAESALSVVPKSSTGPLPAPTVAAPDPRPAQAEPVERWSWVLPVDHGLRADRGGNGAFGAPRAHGGHNGIDLLAALGTPVLAPCGGKARSGSNSSHGKWVQLVCSLPRSLARNPARRVSFFYAHLQKATVGADGFESVERKAVLGSVGKTGNASASIIAPHLHLEAAIHDDEPSALGERHSGRDPSDSLSAHEVAAALSERCTEPLGLSRVDGPLFRGRRVDPYVLLICAAADKPAFSRPSGALGESSYAWSTRYRADAIDVDGPSGFRATTEP